MSDLRPRATQYRDAGCTLLAAFAVLYAEPLAARRAFRAAVDSSGRLRALLFLRNTPERFGVLLPRAEARDVELADEAADEYARCRGARSRPILREVAPPLREVHVFSSYKDRRNAAMQRAEYGRMELRLAEERHTYVRRLRAAVDDAAVNVYVDPKSAARAIVEYGEEHGRSELWSRYYEIAEDFGPMLRTPRTDWLGWLFGLTDTREAETHLIEVRSAASTYFHMLEGAPTKEDVQRAREKCAALDATVKRVEAERVAPVDSSRVLRTVALRLFEAMRLIQPRASEAGPHVRRQLAAMLPTGARYWVEEAVRLAILQDDGGGRERERGRGGGREREFTRREDRGGGYER